MSEHTTPEGADVPGDEARELLIDLVSIPSPSGEEERCANHLASFFESYDREVWIDEVGNVRAPADDRMLLTSHIDTVPGNIPVRVQDGTLWGRGSVDAKGPLAAMAVAAVATGASFAGVVGEEDDSSGAHHLAAEREAPGALVNGEPSGWDGITLGYRGMQSGLYVSTSELGHTSRPDRNAIQHAIDWWTRVERAVEPDEGDEWTPVFERITPKPVAFTGGTDDDGLAVEAMLEMQLRIPPSLTPDEVREIADAQLDEGTVHWREPIPPVMVSPRTPVARAFRAAIRGEGGDPRLVRKTGTSDMNIYARAWDCPMATYGPGDSDLDHTPDEHLPFEAFDRAIAVLGRVASRFVDATGPP